MSQIINNISPDIKELVNDMDLYLIDIKYYNRDSQFFLEIYIDSKDGLTMDECEEATREINKYLDSTDPIDNEYSLIVSSPGLDRPLVTDLDLELALGQELEINFYGSYNGQKRMYGYLIDYDDQFFDIEDGFDNKHKIERSSVSKMTKAIRI